MSDATPTQLAARLNAQYRNPRPLGVLLHVLDYTEDPQLRWMPCNTSRTPRQCAAASHPDRIPASFLFDGMPNRDEAGSLAIMGQGIRGGVVLHPAHARVRCAFGEDGNTRYKPEGCGAWCDEGPHATSRCSNRAWRNYTRLVERLRAEKASFRSHNEVVVDAEAHVHALPRSVLAFFYARNAPGLCCRRAYGKEECYNHGDCVEFAHNTAARFRAAYPSERGRALVVELRLNNSARPFAPAVPPGRWTGARARE